MADKEQKNRLFIALEIPDVMKKEITDHEKDLPYWKWVPAKIMHLTLRFIGDTSEEDAEKLAADFTDVFSGFRMIRLTPVSYDFFPSIRKATSFHVGMQKTHAFDELKKAVDQYVFDRIRLAPEEKFIPHVTVMRLNKPPVKLDEDRIYKWASELELSEPFAERLTLFKSDLNRRGVIHIPLASAEICRP